MDGLSPHPDSSVISSSFPAVFPGASLLGRYSINHASSSAQAAISADEAELAELKDMWTSREISTREYRQMRKTVEDRISGLRRKTLVRPTVEVLAGL